MAVIDPVGLFGGDRLRRCSNGAQLHWPRLFIASNGYGRFEINYALIVGKAYPTFNPIPSEAELQSFIQEYANNFLLFIYEVCGQIWGQWDTKSELLPRYKTAVDRRSPFPPEPAFSEWKHRYQVERKAFTKSFGNISGALLHGVGVEVGVGDGKNIRASHDSHAHLNRLPSVDNPPFDTTELDALFPPEGQKRNKLNIRELSPQQEIWFAQWWSEYWLRRAKKAARDAFGKKVRTQEDFQLIMSATRAQTPEMLARESKRRPHGATWLNGERWNDEVEASSAITPTDDYPEFR